MEARNALNWERKRERKAVYRANRTLSQVDSDRDKGRQRMEAVRAQISQDEADAVRICATELQRIRRGSYHEAACNNSFAETTRNSAAIDVRN